MNYDYGMFEDGVGSIVESIKLNNEKFDCVVGIARGGAIAAVRLSHMLDIPCKFLTWQTREHDLNQDRSTAQSIATSIMIYRKKYLIVDDICDSGKTFKDLFIFWSSIISPDMFNNIKTCTLVFNEAQDLKIDYTDLIIDRNEYPDWINFWWEKKDVL